MVSSSWLSLNFRDIHIHLRRRTVSTSIIQTFVCEEIDGEKVLRAQMTQTCDPSSARRQSWKTVAVLMVIAYPIGFPLLLICLLLPQRARIRELMEEVS